MKFSPSRLNTFTQCNKKFYFQYISGVKVIEPEAPHLKRGTGIHFLFEWYPKVGLKESVRLLIKEGYNLEETEDCLSAFKESLKNEIINYLLNLPNILAEYKIDHEFLNGFIDYLHINEDRAILCDWKSGKFKEDFSFKQINLYAYYLWKEFNITNTKGMYYFVDVDKFLTKAYDIKTLERIERGLLNLINKISEMVKSGSFERTPTRLCDWCAFKSLCDPEGQPKPKMNLKTYKLEQGNNMAKYKVQATNGKEVKIKDGYNTLTFFQGQEVDLSESFVAKYPGYFFPISSQSFNSEVVKENISPAPDAQPLNEVPVTPKEEVNETSKEVLTEKTAKQSKSKKKSK